jgi:hypothetical protein
MVSRLRTYLRLPFTPWGRRILLVRFTAPDPWLLPPIFLLPLVLVPSSWVPNPLLWVSIPLLLVSAVGLVRLFKLWGPELAERRAPLMPVLVALGLLPLGLLFAYMGILTEPYFFHNKRLNRTLRGYNHLAYKNPKGIRTDPVPAAMLLGCLLLAITPRQLRTYPISALDRYSPANWDVGHWENVEVLGDAHNDAGTEFYLDRASAAIRITFTMPVLDYYLERLIQWDEGMHWWFLERPPPFYSQKPFRSHCWGGLLRRAPRDLYFLNTSRPPQYHPSGGYHPLWIARQTAMLLAKETPPNYRGAPRLAPWTPRGGQPAWTRVTGVQRQQRLRELLETNDDYRERTHELLDFFRSKETSMTAMQRYLYHPDAQGERDHRHMRIREHLEEGDAQDRMVEAAIAHDDAMARELFELDQDEFEEELDEFLDDLPDEPHAYPAEGVDPRPYSLFAPKIFVPYDVPNRD